MARNVHDVVDTARDPIVTVLVTNSAVAGKVVARVHAHVCGQVPGGTTKERNEQKTAKFRML